MGRKCVELNLFHQNIKAIFLTDVTTKFVQVITCQFILKFSIFVTGFRSLVYYGTIKRITILYFQFVIKIIGSYKKHLNWVCFIGDLKIEIIQIIHRMRFSSNSVIIPFNFNEILKYFIISLHQMLLNILVHLLPNDFSKNYIPMELSGKLF